VAWESDQGRVLEGGGSATPAAVQTRSPRGTTHLSGLQLRGILKPKPRLQQEPRHGAQRAASAIPGRVLRLVVVRLLLPAAGGAVGGCGPRNCCGAHAPAGRGERGRRGRRRERARWRQDAAPEPEPAARCGGGGRLPCAPKAAGAGAAIRDGSRGRQRPCVGMDHRRHSPRCMPVDGPQACECPASFIAHCKSPHRTWHGPAAARPGRRPRSRPFQAFVDHDGCITLNLILCCWGIREGLGQGSLSLLTEFPTSCLLPEPAQHAPFADSMTSIVQASFTVPSLVRGTLWSRLRGPRAGQTRPERSTGHPRVREKSKGGLGLVPASAPRQLRTALPSSPRPARGAPPGPEWRATWVPAARAPSCAGWLGLARAGGGSRAVSCVFRLPRGGGAARLGGWSGERAGAAERSSRRPTPASLGACAPSNTPTDRRRPPCQACLRRRSPRCAG
jgi:hypothetical protein